MRKIFLIFAALFIAASLGAAEPYRVPVLGDLHYDTPEYRTEKTFLHKFEKYVQMWQQSAPELLANAASHADETSPFVIQLGDIANGYTDSIAHQEAIIGDAFAAVKKFFPHHPLLAVKGNHEVRVILRDQEVDRNEPAARALLSRVAEEAKLPALPNGNFALMHGNDLFLFVDGFDKNADVVKFVAGELADHPDTRYLFLVTHLPVFPGSVKRPNWLLPQYAEIARLLATRNGIILAGHTHAFTLVSYEFEAGKRVTQLIVSSVAVHWQKPGEWLPRYRNYAEFRAAMNKLSKPYKFEKAFPASGYREYVSYPPTCTGYAVLELSDEEASVLIYSGTSGAPHKVVLQKR